jgi:hypothetical protein
MPTESMVSLQGMRMQAFETSWSVIVSMVFVTAALTATPSSDLNTQVELSRDEQEVLWGITACNTRKQLAK